MVVSSLPTNEYSLGRYLRMNILWGVGRRWSKQCAFGYLVQKVVERYGSRQQTDFRFYGGDRVDEQGHGTIGL